MIACIVFVFGAMLEYSGILLLVKLEKMDVKPLKYFYPPVIYFYELAIYHDVNVTVTLLY